MIDILGEEVDIEEPIGSLHCCSIHGQQSFGVDECRVLTNDTVQKVAVVS